MARGHLSKDRSMRTFSWLVVVAAMAGLAGCGGPVDDGAPAGDDGTPDAIGSQDAAASSCGRDTWKTYGASFFRTNCASCHAKGFSSRKSVLASQARVEIASGGMPRDRALTTAERKRIAAWFACGAP
jgi:predicted small lipoprotein YifL